MHTTITILIIFTCLLFIPLVLIQNPKGGFSPALQRAGHHVLGASRASGLVEKTTWVLVTVVMVLSISTTFFK